jgi:hypothetical protein
MTPMSEMVKTKSAKHAVDPTKVHAFMQSLFEEDFHAQRVFSMATGVVGVLHAAAASIHAIGNGLAMATGRESRHAIKQVDRLLSNRGIDVEELLVPWIQFVVAARTEIVVALDWTEFDADGHMTLAAHMITDHGRSTPLAWRTIYKRALESRRSAHERELLEILRKAVPRDIKVTVLADRGFGSKDLYDDLQALGMDFIIRFRGRILVTNAESGERKSANEWVPSNGRVLLLPNAMVTADDAPVAAVVCTKAKGMKAPWCLASSRGDLTGQEIVKLYGRRFTIEESFRDTKDLHFGLGLSATHIGDPSRRDRLLLLLAIAQALLTLLGAAAEAEGLDKRTRAGTSKKRTHSLFRQGLLWYQLLPTARDEWVVPLMRRFGEMVAQHSVFKELFGIL